MAAHIVLDLLSITSTSFDDNKFNQSFIVISWAQGLQIEKTLFDKKLIVELINRKLINKINLRL